MKPRTAIIAAIVAVCHAILLWQALLEPIAERVAADTDIVAAGDRLGQPPASAAGTGTTAHSTSSPHAGRPSLSNSTGVSLPPELAAKTKGCQTGILVDWTGRTVLWRKSETQRVAIASLTKMMTALLLVEAIADRPDLEWTTRVQVTKDAALVGGSQVYLDPREAFSLEELLKCIMIFSANDAAFLVAQVVGGGEPEPFVQKMNARAAELGLNTLKFHNPHGLPPPNGGSENQGSALELALLAATLLDHERVVHWSSTWLSYLRENTPKKFMLVSRNRLVNPKEGCAGVNGMKTGYTRKAGYCIAATCSREGRVLVAVVTKCHSQTQRNELVRALFEWGYSTPVN